MADPVTIQSAIEASGVNPTTIVGTATALPFVLAWVWRQILRVKSKDGLELVKDRAETDVVKTLQEENIKVRADNEKLINRIEKVSEERNLAVQQLGKFSAESEMNRQKIMELQSSVVKMTEKIEEQTKLLHEVLLENVNLKNQIQNIETMYKNLKLCTRI